MAVFSVDRGDCRLAGTEMGKGRVVVFLHAGVADRRSWQAVMARLAAEGVRSVAYDQRGYGDTVCGPSPYSHLDDLLAVLDDRGIDRAVLVGCSRGGQIAFEAACRRPERVAGLMMIGSAPAGAPSVEPDADLRALFEAIERADAAGDLAALNDLEARLWLDGPSAPEGRAAPEARELFLAMNGRALAAPAAGPAAPFEATWDDLPAVTVPTRILIGTFDVPGLVAAAPQIAATIPGAELRVIEGTAHLPMLDDPELVAEEVTRLLARIYG